jgi:hypothetical protein
MRVGAMKKEKRRKKDENMERVMKENTEKQS